MSKPFRILFVCTGNTCRSPMAEGLLGAALNEESLEHIHVSSAGVAAMPGLSASPETVKILKKNNAGLNNFHSRQVDEDILKESDLVITMTSSHAAVVKQYFPEFADKVHLLSDFIDPSEDMEGADIPDPIGMGMKAYQAVAEVMQLAIPNIIKKSNP